MTAGTESSSPVQNFPDGWPAPAGRVDPPWQLEGQPGAGPAPTPQPDPMDDLNVIVPPVEKVVVAGYECRIRRLKTLEVMALLRVVTAGMGENIGSIKLEGKTEEFGPQLAGLLLVSVPAAPREMIALIRAVVEPIDQLDDKQRAAFDKELGNPELETLMAVALTIAAQEKDDIGALLGKAQQMWGHLNALYRTGHKDS